MVTNYIRKAAECQWPSSNENSRWAFRQDSSVPKTYPKCLRLAFLTKSIHLFNSVLNVQ